MTLTSFADSALHLLVRTSLEGAVALTAAILLASLSRTGRIKSWWHRLAHLKLALVLLCITPLTIPLLPANAPSSQSPPSAAALGNVPVSTEQPLAAPPPARESPPSPIPRAVVLSSPAEPIDSSTPIVTRNNLLLTVWLLGALLTLANLTQSCLKTRKLRRRAALPQDTSLLATVAQLAQKLHLRTTPPILLSSETTSPFLTGLLRPAIILPSHLATNASPRTLELILTHELAHLARRDLWWNLLPAALSIPFFFHPLLWLARREWLAAQEIACDQLTLSLANAPPADYARTLLDIVSRASRPGFFAAGMGTFTTTKRRMKAMSHIPSKQTLPLIALALAAALGLMPWRLVAQPTSETAPPTGEVPAVSLSEDQRQTFTTLLGKLNDQKALLQAKEEKIAAEFQAVNARMKTTSDEAQLKALQATADKLHLQADALQNTINELQKLIDSTTIEMDPARSPHVRVNPANRPAAPAAENAVPLQAAQCAATLDAQSVKLAPPVDGVVNSVNVAEGQHVKQGDILFTLEGNDRANAVSLARLDVESARISYERASAGASAAAISAAERDAARAALQRAQIILEKAQNDLEKLAVRSPIDGVVSQSDLVSGQFVSKGAPAITVVDTAHLFVTFYFPQPQSSPLHTGQMVSFSTRPDAAAANAEIIFVSPTVDASTGVCRVKAQIKSGADDLKPGMFGTVTIPPA